MGEATERGNELKNNVKVREKGPEAVGQPHKDDKTGLKLKTLHIH